MSKEDDQHIPDIIYDRDTCTQYKKGRFFGKGGFAKCYEIKNITNNQSYAGKIVSKKLLLKQSQKEKMSQEIHIHQSLRHKNIVGFHNFFEDSFNIYIVLELCKNRSMMELHKRRKTISEPETRYYMKQIISGVEYLHQKRIIHRDLKLGNLFLNHVLVVKIGDFGLAAKIEYDGERKKTLCGTPNYIAPEILAKKGHSFEVDIWSIGCIMYTLLMGKPPFETDSLKETYARIKKCEYRINKSICPSAKYMITMMLQSDPTKRPNIGQLQLFEFLSNGYCPPSLPITCLTMAPRFDKVDVSVRKPLLEINHGEPANMSPFKPKVQNSIASYGVPVNHHASHVEIFDARENFIQLQAMLLKVLKTKPGRTNLKYLDEMTDPQAQPMYWVSKWVDYSDKYGFGYQLSDESVGVMFNDTTKLIMLPNGINVHYIDRTGDEIYMTLDNYPIKYDKKMKLLSYFNRYMREHLVKTGASEAKEVDSISRMPHLHQWVRSTSGVLMQLNNGTIQMNFGDHTKIIMCTLMAAVTYIDEDRSFRTFKFETIEKNGCSVGLYEKMRYAYDKVCLLLDTEMNKPQ